MDKIIDFAPYLKESAEDSFSMKLGGTTYEVTTHFNPSGNRSVLEQFKDLLLKNEFIPHI